MTKTKQPISLSPFYQDGKPLNPVYKKFLPVLVMAMLIGTSTFGFKVIAMTFCGWLGSFLVAVSFSKARDLKMDQSFWITGVLTAFCLPIHLPLVAVTLAAAFGQFFAKEVFGGFGANMFNPAIVGRVFITLAFPLYFTSNWILPKNLYSGLSSWITDAVTGATPLMAFRATGKTPDFMDSILGNCGGSVCETSAIFFILVIVYMQYKKIGKFTFSYSFLISLTLLSLAGWLVAPTLILAPHLQLSTGGILAGAALFCTDPVTSPRDKKSLIYSGIMLGFLVLIIRSFSSFPEGFMFSLLLVNMFSPLFDLYFTGKLFKSKEKK